MKAARAWLIGALVLVAVAIGVFFIVRAVGKKPVVKYETVKVDQGRIVARVTATGTLSAIVTVQVGSQVSGRIKEILVDFNSVVKKGDIIAKIDPELFKAAIEQAKANYAAARGNLEKSKAMAVDAERVFQRSATLAEKQLIATADRDTAESTAAAAKAQVAASQGALEQASASLHTAQVNLDYSIIKSPIDGVVISRAIDVGQTVAASLSAPTLFTIAEDLGKMQVDTNVAEADVGKLLADMPATFTVDAYPQEKFRGKVRQIRNAPLNVQNVVTYDAVIDVDNVALKLKPGMTANVTFTYAEKTDVLRVPNAALRFRPPADLARSASSIDSGAPLSSSAEPTASGSSERPRRGGSGSGSGSGSGERGSGSGSGERGSGGGKREQTTDVRTVWVLDALDPRPVRIRVGLSDGSLTEVVEGELKAGDPLVTEATGGEDAPKPTTGTPAPGAPAPAGGGLRRVF
jgi:HlyD family secretion protein